MGRRRKAKEVEAPVDQNERATVGANGRFDPEKTQGFVDRIENLHADIATRMAEALNDCRAIHGDIKIVYQEAKDEAGIPKKPF